MSLPRYDTRFIDRDPTVQSLRAALGGPGALVTLTGQGGLGKTRLAVELCWSWVRDAGRRSAVFCDLCTVQTEADAWARLFAACGIPDGFHPGSPIALRVSAWIGEHGTAVVVLDNAETALEEASALAARLRASLPGLRLLITSRAPLGLFQEREIPVPALPESAAAELFRDRWSGITRTADISSILAKLGGLPLAVELAAGRLDVLSVPELAARLCDPLVVLRTPEGEGRHGSLHRVLHDTWRDLPDWAQRAALQLRCFEGDFDLVAAESVLSLGPNNRPLDAVHLLRRRGLLWRLEQQDGPPRFQLVPFIRDFMQGLAPEELDGAILRHAVYYGETGARMLERIEAMGAPDERQWLAVEMSNMRALVRRGMADSRISPHHTAVAGLVTDRHERTLIGEDAVIERTQALVDGAQCLRAPWHARLLMMRSRQAVRRGETAESLRLMRIAVPLAKESGDPALLATCLGLLGDRESRMGNQAVAVDCFERGLALAVEHGAAAPEAANLAALAIGDIMNVNRLPRSIARLRRAAEISVDNGNDVIASWSFFRLGQARIAVGDRDAAEADFARAREHGKRGYHVLYESVAIQGLGQVHHLRGDVQGAIDLYRLAIPMAVAAGHRDDAADMRIYLAFALLELHRLPEAEGQLRAALDVLLRGPREWATYRCAALSLLAATRFRAGDQQGAEEHLAAARAEVSTLLEPAYEACIWFATAVDAACRAEAAMLTADPGLERVARQDLLGAAERMETGYLALIHLQVRLLGQFRRQLELAARTWVVSSDGTRFCAPGQDDVDLSRHRSVVRILRALANGRASQPGRPFTVAELVEAGWPGERVVPGAGRNRLYVAISKLRSLGLTPLTRDRDGYRLDADTPIKVE